MRVARVARESLGRSSTQRGRGVAGHSEVFVALNVAKVMNAVAIAGGKCFGTTPRRANANGDAGFPSRSFRTRAFAR
jgi:hypothetical protein